MLAVLAFVVVSGAAFSLGWLLLIALSDGQVPADGDAVETVVLSLALGLAVIGWLALVLAEIGWFSLAAMAVVWAAGVGGLGLLLRRRGRQVRFASVALSRLEAACLAVWLIAAGYLFFRPHHFLVGGADAGVYVSLGSSIARSGGIVIHDQTLAEMDRSLYPVLLREFPPSAPAPYYVFPGFYVSGVPAGEVVPQFYPLHPVWLALFHSLGGLEANLLGTPFWALLGSAAVYLALRQMLGRHTALLALAALTVTAMQVWFARYPTAEMLTQYLFWIGMYTLSAWVSGRRPARSWALAAGLTLGQVFLTRIDTYFLLAIPVALAFWFRWRRDRPRGFAWFLVPLLALALHSLLHGALLSWPYFSEVLLSGGSLLATRLAVPLALLALLAAVSLAVWLVLDRRIAWRERIGRQWPKWHPVVASIAAAAVAGLAVYGYWVRPGLGDPTLTYAYWYGGTRIPGNLDSQNLVRLAWYLSPLGVALATGGVGLLLWKLNRKTAVFVGTGLFFSLFYLWRIQNNPHQIYTMRRYVPVVLPFLTAAAAYLLSWFHARPVNWQKWGARLLAAAWLASVAWLARGFVSQVDYRGVGEQLDALNLRLAPRSVLIFNDQSPVGPGDVLGTPLHFLYEHDVFSLRRPDLAQQGQLERQIARWQAQGREVYWIGPADATVLGTYTLEDAGSLDVASAVLENTYESRPQQRVTMQWSYPISRVVTSVEE